MTTTTYYNLNIVEGTDIVNPLIVDNPNYEKIDEAMHNNAVAGVTLATEIANATVHAITRENSDCAVIRFIATSEWKAGDTATVDGVPVTALLPSGETLPDGAYVINANVLCILTGTNLTIYAERKKSENANEITFNDTNVAAELVKLDGEIVRLDGEIDNVNNNLQPRMINITNVDVTDSSNWAERSGKLVIVHLYCTCIPYNKPTLISGLPTPIGNKVSQWLGTVSPSIVELDSTGRIYIDSAGTASGVTSIISGTFAYFTNAE